MDNVHATGGRVIRPENLDDETGPDKQASLRDLLKYGRYCGGDRVLRGLVRRLVAAGEPHSWLDVGAASGNAGQVIRGVRPMATVTSLDYRQEHLAEAPSPRVVGDAFGPPFRGGSFDFVFCSLFLHHFEDAAVVELLRMFGAIARRAVVVVDLERGPGAYYFTPLTVWLFRWNRITLHDAPASVEAAFKKQELESLARSAGFRQIHVRRHRPWARLSLVAQP
ncbi:MAG TPA: methyltransferase domain-containing protein [Bryobacteraceae bacterium]|nr:methyltransferase domain-containing protein [Bryobacteraceae bacterium]